MFASRFAVGKSTVTQAIPSGVVRLNPLCNQFPHLQRRTAYRIGYPGGGPRYSRFDRVNYLKARWSQSPVVRYGAVCLVGCGVYFYTSNLEEVPVSGRRRFNIVSPEVEEEFAKQMYRQALQQFGNKVLPAYHPDSRLVQRVLNRLIPASGLGDEKWEIHVINDPKQINAFVVPGGKVFVFSGILPICETEDGLAVVLGHEIAHNVAHHSAERLSQVMWMYIGMWALSSLFGSPDFLSQILIDFGFMRPGSRKQESEADYIGLKSKSHGQDPGVVGHLLLANNIIWWNLLFAHELPGSLKLRTRVLKAIAAEFYTMPKTSEMHIASLSGNMHM
ncbi:hypothetical protein GP486_000969 [Trichoglossum hirsutum]|uniref:Peptidase M48 domain-containing protein n=1 Tax=Trichoglossum hirsutum TaxID=265104 RepID=A0A9P8RTH0_9PEZI|nr:hypothetical protein GP486_000969 [Trichoglossum hirsutum]